LEAQKCTGPTDLILDEKLDALDGSSGGLGDGGGNTAHLKQLEFHSYIAEIRSQWLLFQWIRNGRIN